MVAISQRFEESLTLRSAEGTWLSIALVIIAQAIHNISKPLNRR